MALQSLFAEGYLPAALVEIGGYAQRVKQGRAEEHAAAGRHLGLVADFDPHRRLGVDLLGPPQLRAGEPLNVGRDLVRKGDPGLGLISTLAGRASWWTAPVFTRWQSIRLGRGRDRTSGGLRGQG